MSFCKYHPEVKAIINYGGEPLCVNCYEPNRHGIGESVGIGGAKVV
jgi:hypothetical protein